ncbi:MAG: hypothetical protein ACI4XG_15010, partial [Bradyrhizobium sp.]
MQILSTRILPTLARSTLLACTTLLACGPSRAAGCNFEIQGEGRVATVVDARSLRLDDGREVRLAGIEVADRAKAMAALTAQLVGREVTLRGQGSLTSKTADTSSSSASPRISHVSESSCSIAGGS